MVTGTLGTNCSFSEKMKDDPKISLCCQGDLKKPLLSFLENYGSLGTSEWLSMNGPQQTTVIFSEEALDCLRGLCPKSRLRYEAVSRALWPQHMDNNCQQAESPWPLRRNGYLSPVL